MPSTPQPIIGNMGIVWTPVVQALQTGKQKAANLAASAQQTNFFDAYYNCTTVCGTNLNQVVTIAATHMQGGVEVWTGIANGVSGMAVQTALAIGTLTVTKGSTAATLTSTASGTFSGGGNVIGAIDASDNDVLSTMPGTTYTISGTSVTLSQPALESGTSLYCAQAVFSIVT